MVGLRAVEGRRASEKGVIFRRSRRRREALAAPFSDEWREVLAARVAHWRLLDDDDRARLEDLIRELLARKNWEAARGFVLTEEMKVTIAAMAGLLVLGLDYDCYRGVHSIIVHPTTLVLGGRRTVGMGGSGIVSDAPMPILGQAQYRGPVVIAWDSARDEARHPHRGHNVVYHEFAHKLDMLDGVIDGTPPLDDPETAQRWIDVCTAEYDGLQQGRRDPLLRPYAGVNPGEFFAVATEVFFDRPERMEQAKPDLYEVLRGFYRQDPAGRERRARARSSDAG